jgi:hypothetical protein
MEHSTVDCAEWDSCSYEHHPVDDIEPIDTTSPAYREASLHLLKVVGIIDTFLTGSRDARMAATAFSIAFGLSSTRGRTLTEVATDLGVTKQALSRYVCRFLRMSRVAPAFGLKSPEARRHYQVTNGHIPDRDAADASESDIAAVHAPTSQNSPCA